MNEKDIRICDRCKVAPRYFEVSGLWYVQCPVCGRIEVNPNRIRVVDHWNEVNVRWSRASAGVKAAKAERAKDKGRAIRESEALLRQAHVIYQLLPDGTRGKRYCSMAALDKELGVKKGTIAGYFYRSKTGIIKYNGERYERDTTKTSSARNGGCGKDKTGK